VLGVLKKKKRMAKFYRVKDLNEALNLAVKFKETGEYNLFRGQALNWHVKSSIARLSTEESEIGIEKLKRLYYYLQTYKPLEKYVSDIDWFYAVAQHYGLPTTYVDFTDNPEVAVYFATNSESNKVDKESVIICLNEVDFNRLVNDTKDFFENKKIIPPYIIKPNVDNLWRLQAQNGCFIFVPISEIEQFYDFDRIVFPFTEPYTKIEKEHIYPEKKSELEILLDHYFSSEKRIEGQKRFKDFAAEVNMNQIEYSLSDVDVYLKKKQIHSSWHSNEFENWIFKIEENWSNLNSVEEITINFSFKNNIDNQIALIIDELSLKFIEKQIKRNDVLDFNIISKPRLSNKLAKQVNKSCTRIWDGTRNLPFLDKEIIEIIAKYICLEIYENKFDKIPSLTQEKLITLELTNEYGSITRCHASPSKILSSFRSDIREILIDELTLNISTEILLCLNNPKLLFDFDNLLSLFKDELIAYQVLYNSENENPVIFYTPTQITVLGYA
jgi:FRG domain.